MSAADVDPEAGLPVPESSLLVQRLDEMRQNERVAPYLYWFFLLVILGLTPFATRPVYLLVEIVPFVIVPFIYVRRPMLARAVRIANDHVRLEARGQCTVVYFSTVVKCIELPVAWDDSGEAPFMKSLSRLVLTLDEHPSRCRRVMVLEGREKTVSRALAAAGVPVTRAKWASKYADETGTP